MTQILSIDNQSKEIIIYKDGEIFDIEKDLIHQEEAYQLIELIKQHPQEDIVTETVSSIKYHKTISGNINGKTVSTTYEINLMKPSNYQEINKYRQQVYENFIETYELYKKFRIQKLD